MKNILLGVTIPLIISIFNSCQSSSSKRKEQNNFNGILEFEINKTTVQELDSLKYKSREITFEDGITNTIKEYGISSVTEWELLCDGVRIFNLDGFKSGTVEFLSVNLTFLNDTLINVSSRVNYEMLDVLQSKYPNYNGDFDDNKQSYDWYNKSVYATFTSYKRDDFSIFRIYDSDKTLPIFLKTDSLKADFIKKINSNI